MQQQVFATKANLMNAKKSLQMSKMGYDLLDRKRNVLIRELMQNMEAAKSLRGVIEQTYEEAYTALQDANITLGIIDQISRAVPIENSIEVSTKSVMGVEVPMLKSDRKTPKICYGFYMSNSELDTAFIKFDKVKQITITLAEIENSIYRLSTSIKKAQMRANALKNILIPRFQEQVKFITESLEEKEREEFSRLKVIKVRKNKDAEIARKKVAENIS
ncbi:MAG: V-type ATP synthase subunit D [Oscillospiraceae bacterium]|jgi:V/A-type H+-transporting ATPase subunit D|nr:V-type ATP synthase subunit D [Oscillospiraceae bacterium]